MKSVKFFVFVLVVVASLFVSCGGEGPRPASHYEIWGIDISKHQNVVNWENLFDHEKPYFVFLKATEGTLIKDPTYERHAKQLAETDVLWGAYHFFGHRTSGKEQAKNFIETAKLKKGNLIPVLDIEHHRFFKDPAKMVREVKAFCKEIKNHYGVYPIIYCSSKFYTHYLEADFPADRYVLWVADYSNIPTAKWQFWQHTDSHRVKGTKSKVDRNVFAGDYEKLKKLIIK